jgi:YHS domain-containing protein
MRVLISCATLLALAACSTEGNLLAPDHESDKILSSEKPHSVKGKGRGADPVCGAPMDQTHVTWHSSYDGAEYYFDSEECKRQFDENPALYTSTVR